MLKDISFFIEKMEFFGKWNTRNQPALLQAFYFCFPDFQPFKNSYYLSGVPVQLLCLCPLNSIHTLNCQQAEYQSKFSHKHFYAHIQGNRGDVTG